MVAVWDTGKEKGSGKHQITCQQTVIFVSGMN